MAVIGYHSRQTTLSIDDLRDAVTSLASRIDSPLILEDDRQRLVTHSPHHTIPDEARREAIMARSLRPEVIAWCEAWGIRTAERAIRTPRDDTIGILGRVCAPVRYNGVLLGFIWAIDDSPLDNDAVAALEETAAAISIQMYRDRAAVELGSELLRGLVSTSAELRGISSNDAAVRSMLPTGTEAVVMVVRGGPVDDVDALIRRESSKNFRCALGDEMVVLLPQANVDKRRDRQLAISVLLQAPEEWKVAIGLSDPHPSTNLHQAYREASYAALVAETIPTEGRIAHWGRLGAYRLLARAATSADSEGLDEPRLAALIGEPELLSTLETYLDLAGSAKATAAALHIHRATLYYRLERIAQLTGVDLGAGAERLALHIALKMLRLRGAFPQPPDSVPETQTRPGATSGL